MLEFIDTIYEVKGNFHSRKIVRAILLDKDNNHTANNKNTTTKIILINKSSQLNILFSSIHKFPL